MKDYHARISPAKRNQILQCFIDDLIVSSRDPSQASAIGKCKLNHKTVERFYRYIREILYEHQRQLVRFSGEIEIDHAEFGGRRKKRYHMIEGRPVPLANKKIPVLGILQRGPDSHSHKVFLQIVKRLDRRVTIPPILHVVEPGSYVFTDMHRSFTALGTDYKHKRVNHSRREFSRLEDGVKVSTGTIDQFWSYCDKRLARFAGIAYSTIHLHVHECAFRYNHKKDLAIALKKIIHDHENPPVPAALAGISKGALARIRTRLRQKSPIRRKSRTHSVEKARRIPKP